MERFADKPDDRDLQAYADGQLTPDEAAALEARLAESPEDAAAVDAHLEQKRLIREAADALAPAAVDLRTAALERRLIDRLTRRAPSGRPRLPVLLRQAAAAVLLVGAGWVGHGQYAALSDAPPGYVAEAVGAHAVFADDAFRPVEFAAEASDVALQWAAAKLGREVSLPELGPLGITLVGARLHGTAEGPIAQFIYEDAEGARLSLIIARHPPEVPAQAFRLATYADASVGYWSDSALDYALVAKTSPAQLRAIASEISPGGAI